MVIWSIGKFDSGVWTGRLTSKIGDSTRDTSLFHDTEAVWVCVAEGVPQRVKARSMMQRPIYGLKPVPLKAGCLMHGRVSEEQSTGENKCGSLRGDKRARAKTGASPLRMKMRLSCFRSR
jgi:hypothetical protein